MLSVVAILSPVILLILLGYALNRAGFPGEGFWPSVERLTYYVFYPCLLFGAIARSDMTADQAGWFAVTLLAALLTMAIFLAIIRRIAGWHGPRYTSIYQGSMRWNGFVALAVADAFLGPEGLAMTAIGIAVMVPTLNVLSVYTLTRHAGAEPQNFRLVLRLLSQNPLIISCVAGIAVNLLEIYVPSILADTMSMLADGALTIGLLAVGASLQFAIPRDAFGQLGCVSAFKLLLMPLFVTIFCVMFGVTGISFAAAMICASVPTAPSSYILARQLGGDADFMAQAVTASTLAAAITMPLILYLTSPI